jgi:putative ABC transport system ATP-binding protein
MSKILNIRNLEKTFSSGSREITVLKDITFDIEERETFSIVGPSGSGKDYLTWIMRRPGSS